MRRKSSRTLNRHKKESFIELDSLDHVLLLFVRHDRGVDSRYVPIPKTKLIQMNLDEVTRLTGINMGNM